MEYSQFIMRLRPQFDGTIQKESFDDYKERIGTLLPNWPDDPLENWLYRHYQQTRYFSNKLKFDSIKFSLTKFSKQDIFEKIGTEKMNTVEGIGGNIFDEVTVPQQHFFKHGTWIVPIIIISTNIYEIDQKWDKKPFYLLEGHARLGNFRHLYREAPDILIAEHEVWIVTV